MKLVYFAWVRERIGRSEEELQIPAQVATVGQLLEWLRGRGPEYDHALSDMRVIRCAVDKVHSTPDASIEGAREIALFPPMTGG